MNVTGELKDLVVREGLTYEIESLQSVKWDQNIQQYTLEVLWLGFGPLEASFEPLDSMLEQVPLLVFEFLDEFARNNPNEFKIFWKATKPLILRTIRTRSYDITRFTFIEKGG